MRPCFLWANTYVAFTEADRRGALTVMPRRALQVGPTTWESMWLGFQAGLCF